MKKNVLYRTMPVLLTAALLLSIPVFSVDGGNSKASEQFYDELVQMVNAQDDSFYFSNMELTVGSSTMTVDGEAQALDVAPEIVGSRTMLPIRAIAEAAGAEVGWSPSSGTITITSAAGDEINCSIGSDVMTINGEKSGLDVVPYIKDDRTYLPVRAVTEALEMDVDWDQSTQTVSLSAPYQTSRVIVLANALDTKGLNAQEVINDGAGTWILQFNSPTEAKEAVEKLEKRGVTAEPDTYIASPIEANENEIVNLAAIITSSSKHTGWGAENCGFDSFIEANAGSFTGSAVVAVVDTGVDDSHELLRGRVLKGLDLAYGGNAPTKGARHGTHVAGIIIDCAGSAPVQILPVRVFEDSGIGAYSSTIKAGIDYAAGQGADVINLSFGVTHSDAIDMAVNNAIKKGSLVVMSAGNAGIDTKDHCPSHVKTPGAMEITAGDQSHNKYAETNYGDNVDLMAPGVAVRSSVPGSYAQMDGTSMAAAHVSAAAALLDLAWGKSLSPAELEGKLHAASTYGKWTNQYVGYGFLDMSRAPVPTATPSPSPTPTPTPSSSPSPSPSPSTSPAPTAAVVSYEFDQTELELEVGETANVKVTAVYSDGSKKDVTSSAGLTSSNTSAATVSSSGSITAKKEGTTLISITYAGTEGTVSLPAPIRVTVISASVPTPTPEPVNDPDFTIENGVLIKYNGPGGAVTIPNGVTRIGNEVFRYCHNLDSVIIPNSVTAIDGSAFEQCHNLTSVNIPNSVISIGDWAFSGCQKLTSVTIPNSVTNIGRGAFSICYNLTGVTIPNSITTISYQMFRDCSRLTSVTIPNSVTTIERYAFSDCNRLTSVTISSSVTSIADFAFEGCSSLKDVYYGGSEAQWDQIAIDNYLKSNKSLLNATIHFGS